MDVLLKWLAAIEPIVEVAMWPIAIVVLVVVAFVTLRSRKDVEVDDRRSYKGEVNAAGLPHGQGVETWPDGMRYEGKFTRGLPSGEGVVTWPDGRRFEGRVRNGQPHGQGVMTWPDGRREEGTFEHGEPFAGKRPGGGGRGRGRSARRRYLSRDEPGAQ